MWTPDQKAETRKAHEIKYSRSVIVEEEVNDLNSLGVISLSLDFSHNILNRPSNLLRGKSRSLRIRPKIIYWFHPSHIVANRAYPFTQNSPNIGHMWDPLNSTETKYFEGMGPTPDQVRSPETQTQTNTRGRDVSFYFNSALSPTSVSNLLKLTCYVLSWESLHMFN